MDRIKADAMRAVLGFPSGWDEFLWRSRREPQLPGEVGTPGLKREETFAYYERRRVLNALEAKGVTVDELAAWVATLGRTAALWEKFGIEDVMSPAPPADRPLPEPKRRAVHRGPVLVPVN